MEIGNLSSLLEVSFALHVGYGALRSVNHFGIEELENYTRELESIVCGLNGEKDESVSQFLRRLDEMRQLNSKIKLFIRASLLIALLSLACLIIAAFDPKFFLSNIKGSALIVVLLLPMPTFMLTVWLVSKNNRDLAKKEFPVLKMEHEKRIKILTEQARPFRANP